MLADYRLQDLAPLTELQNLETLNLRNLPEQMTSRITPPFALQEHESLAADIATSFRNACPTDCSPKLKIIATGTITYRAHWLGSLYSEYSATQYYLCPRFFHVGWPVNVKNRRVPVLTLVAQGTAIEAREYSSSLRIFDDYWMR